MGVPSNDRLLESNAVLAVDIVLECGMGAVEAEVVVSNDGLLESNAVLAVDIVLECGTETTSMGVPSNDGLLESNAVLAVDIVEAVVAVVVVSGGRPARGIPTVFA